MGKLADDLRPKCEHAHPDQRLEISLLGLFSYDRFSIVLREKGWILPLESYLSKPVGHTNARICICGLRGSSEKKLYILRNRAAEV